MSEGRDSDNSTNITFTLDIMPTIYVSITLIYCLSIAVLNGYFAWITLTKKTFKNTFVVYLVPINMADFSIGLLGNWRVVAEVTHNNPYDSCFVQTLLGFTSVGTSFTMLLLISVVQYVSIAHPLKYRNVMGMRFAIISSCCVPAFHLTFNSVLFSVIYDKSNDTTICRDINLFKLNYNIVGIFSLVSLCVVLIGIMMFTGLCIYSLKQKSNAISIIEGCRNIEVRTARMKTPHSLIRQLRIQGPDISLFTGNKTNSSIVTRAEHKSGAFPKTNFYKHGFKTFSRLSHTKRNKRKNTLILQRTQSRVTIKRKSSSSRTNDVTNEIKKGCRFDSFNVSASRSHSTSTCRSKLSRVNHRKKSNDKLLSRLKVKFGFNRLRSKYTREAIRPIRFKSNKISPAPIKQLRDILKLSTDVDRSSRRMSHRSLGKTYLKLTSMSLVALACLLPYIMRITWYLLYRHVPETLIMLSDFAISANSAFNPIIFVFRFSQYKEQVRKLPICCCCGKECEFVRRNLSSMQNNK